MTGSTYPNDVSDGDLGVAAYINAFKTAFLNHHARHLSADDPLFTGNTLLLGYYVGGKVQLDRIGIRNWPYDSRFLQFRPETVNMMMPVQAMPNGVPNDTGDPLVNQVLSTYQVFGTDFSSDMDNYDAMEFTCERLAGVKHWYINVWQNVSGVGHGVYPFEVRINGLLFFEVNPGGDIIVWNWGKGIVLTNAAGTIQRRVRLNDAGDGLIFEAM